MSSATELAADTPAVDRAEAILEKLRKAIRESHTEEDLFSIIIETRVAMGGLVAQLKREA